MAEEETTETTSEDETTTTETEETTTSTETTSEPDWKSESRKHERRSKAEKKRADELEAKLAAIEASNQTEQEKAIAKAKEEAKAEALAESAEERRRDRLEVASTRIATTGIKVKDADDKDVVLKFADPDDALIYLERAIKNGDVDHDDIFNDEGKVQTDALSSALQQILESKPHLQANGIGTPAPKVKGSADGGKGSAGKDEESKSVDEIFKSISGSPSK